MFFQKTPKMTPRPPRQVGKHYIWGQKQVWTLLGGHWGHRVAKIEKLIFTKEKQSKNEVFPENTHYDPQTPNISQGDVD